MHGPALKRIVDELSQVPYLTQCVLSLSGEADFHRPPPERGGCGCAAEPAGEEIGRGGMATVFRAERTEDSRTVAIKLLHEGSKANRRDWMPGWEGLQINSPTAWPCRSMSGTEPATPRWPGGTIAMFSRR